MLLERLLALTSAGSCSQEWFWQLFFKSLASHGGVEHTASTDGPTRSGFIVGVVWAISVVNRFLPTYLFIRFCVDSAPGPHAQAVLRYLVCSVGLICLLSNGDSYFSILIHHHHVQLSFSLFLPSSLHYITMTKRSYEMQGMESCMIRNEIIRVLTMAPDPSWDNSLFTPKSIIFSPFSVSCLPVDGCSLQCKYILTFCGFYDHCFYQCL